MADLSKYFVGQSTGSPTPTASSGTPGLQPVDNTTKIRLLQEDADKAKRESDKANSFGSQAGTFGKELVGGLANAFLKQPARFVTSAAVAPVDLARQGYGAVTGKETKPLDVNLPFVGKTFQRQASDEGEQLYDKAYAGEKLGVGDYATALKPFAEVPLAALETVALSKGLGEAKTLFQKSADKAKEKYLYDILTPTESVAKNSGYMSAIKTGRVEPAGMFNSRSVTPDKNMAALVEELKTVPGIKKGQELLKTTNAVHKEIGATAQNLRTALRGRDIQPTVSVGDINKLYEDVQGTVSKNPFLSGDASKSADDIFKEFISRLPKDRPIVAEDILDARQGVDKWIASQRGPGIFDPAKENAVSAALRAIRQGANGLLADKAQDVAVKEMLLRQTRLFDAIDEIAVKAAKENGISAAAKVINPLWKLTKQAAGYGAVVGASYFGAKAAGALGE